MYGAQVHNVSENKKATRQLGWPFLSRENSSNGGQGRQNFLAKSYGPKKGGVKRFLENKYLCFQLVTKEVIGCQNRPERIQKHPRNGLTASD
jgi:hypothetical protein